jgi:hypothetical protein
MTGKELVKKEVNGTKELDEIIDISHYLEFMYILNIYENENSPILRYAKKIVKIF